MTCFLYLRKLSVYLASFREHLLFCNVYRLMVVEPTNFALNCRWPNIITYYKGCCPINIQLIIFQIIHLILFIIQELDTICIICCALKQKLFKQSLYIFSCNLPFISKFKDKYRTRKSWQNDVSEETFTFPRSP